MTRFIGALILLMFNVTVYAALLSGDVKDTNGTAVFDVVITVYPTQAEQALTPLAQTTHKQPEVIDQVNREFIGHVQVIRKNDSVTFPNNDNIKHHVYSFSPAKRFEIKLYNGDSSQTIRFEKEGVVVLGCNIHDWMVAYIYVADTPYFTKTDVNGHWSIELPANDYKINLWRYDFDMVDASTSKFFKVVNGNNVSDETVKLKSHHLSGKAPPLLEQGYQSEP
jgi:plastocyanin